MKSTALKNKVEFALDLLFPKLCQSCGVEGTYLCASCQGKIKAPLERCFVCSKNSFLGILHEECKSENTALHGLMIAADYHDRAIQSLVWHLKYGLVEEISSILALIMVDYMAARELLDYFASAAVVAVPLYKSKRRSRGFNQAELIAEEFSKRLTLEYLPILKKVKNSESQTELEREERLENVKGLFIAAPMPSLGERKIILIDDVATTGATLNECAKVLRVQRPSEIWGLVVARN